MQAAWLARFFAFMHSIRQPIVACVVRKQRASGSPRKAERGKSLAVHDVSRLNQVLLVG